MATLDEFIATLDRLGNTQFTHDLLDKAAKRTGVYMENVFAAYPDEPILKPSPDENGAAVVVEGKKGEQPVHRPLPKIHQRKRIKNGEETNDTYLSKWKTAKQQGWFFANLSQQQGLKAASKGKLAKTPTGQAAKAALALSPFQFPYRRSGLLGRSWTSTYSISGNTVRIEVGSNAPYADYVVGEQQISYHEITGWNRVDEELEARSDEFVEFFADSFMSYLDDALGLGNP